MYAAIIPSYDEDYPDDIHYFTNIEDAVKFAKLNGEDYDAVEEVGCDKTDDMEFIRSHRPCPKVLVTQWRQEKRDGQRIITTITDDVQPYGTAALANDKTMEYTRGTKFSMYKGEGKSVTLTYDPEHYTKEEAIEMARTLINKGERDE